jgi:hypothetical protein
MGQTKESKNRVKRLNDLNTPALKTAECLSLESPSVHCIPRLQQLLPWNTTSKRNPIILEHI